jgi:calcineurin-like phosphoesterase family protein
MGNHDMYATEDYLRHFTRLTGAVEYKGLILTHVPVHESQLARWYMNVHGHLHTKRVMKPAELQLDGTTLAGNPDPRYVCVSAELVELTPVPFDWILNKWAEAN